MTFDIRRIGPGERGAAWRLGSLAFGYHRTPMPDGPAAPPGEVTWGAYDGSGRLVAQAIDLEHGQWFGGRVVPAAGVAGVAVTPEMRGRGIAAALLTRLLTEARDRGAVISSLYPTTAAPYRRLGWEIVGAQTYTAWPTSELAAVRAPDDVRLRPAEETDVPAIATLYRDAARTSTGMMERSGPQFTMSPADLLGSTDGLTVAVGAGDTLVGFASWDRGPGYDSTGRVTVHDLMGATAGATAALIAMFGSWASVAPTVVLQLHTPDPARFLFPPGSARVETHKPWMLRLIDVVGAVAARGWPAHLSGEVDLELTDDRCPWNAGRYRLILDRGTASLAPSSANPAEGAGMRQEPGKSAVRFGPRGLAAWYAGAASPAVLRRAGLLDGPEEADGLLLAATAGPPPELHDYF